jgi:ABC-2 type transport system permease protein
MVSLLIRMNLAMQHDALKGARLFWASVAILLALGTAALSVIKIHQPVVLVDLAAAAFAAWTLILALAPVFGGGGRGIRPEHFALLPLPPRRLALGLLGAAVVGLAPAIALVAFAALAVYGFQLGFLPGLAGVLAAFLHLLLGVLLARLVYAGMGAAMQTRLGMEIVALMFALFLAVLSVGWFVIEPVAGQINQILAEGWPPPIAAFFRLLPSGWGWLAVEAASRGDWGRVVFIFLGFMGLIGGLFLLWTALMARSPAQKPASYAVRGRSSIRRAASPLRLPPTPVSAVIAKELRAWLRDPWRALNLRIAFWTGLLIGVIPLLIGWVDLLPFVGVLIVLIGGGVSGNLYAGDGSALWLTLLTPCAARVDVRARQWAWLLIFAPASILATVIFTLLSGQPWAWPLALSLLFATLGGAAGLALLFSVRFPSPGLDPLLRKNPMDSSGGTLNESFFLPWLAALAGLPAVVVVWLGYRLENPLLQRAGLPVGIVSGAGFAWGLGRIAYRRLEESGPELLNLLLKGPATQEITGEKSISDKAWNELPIWKKVIVWICGALFWIPLSIQGILPIVLKLNGVVGASLPWRTWILAFNVPVDIQWPVIIAMLALGVLMAILAFQIPRKHLREVQQREAGA